MKIKKYSFLIGPLIFIYILYKIDLNRLFGLLSSVKITFILLAIAVLPLFFLLMTLKWKKIIDSSEIKFSFKNTLISFLKGTALGVVTPGKLGELYRFKYLQRISKSSFGISLATVVIDRLIDLVALIILGLVSVLMLVHIYAVKISVLMIVLFFCFFILCLIILTKKRYMKKILRPFFRMFVPENHKEMIASHFHEFYKGLKSIGISTYLICILYTLMVWTLNILVVYLLGKSLMLGIPFWFMVLVVPLVTIVNLIPVSVSGLGTSQAAFIFTLSLIGISSESAVALSILVIALSLIRAIPGAIIYAFKK